MAITTVFRPIGPTTAITTSTSSSSAVTISASGNNQMDFCAFLNTGSTPISIKSLGIYLFMEGGPQMRTSFNLIGLIF